MPRTEQRDGSRQRARSGQDTDEKIWAAETEGRAERRKGAEVDHGHPERRSASDRASEIAHCASDRALHRTAGRCATTRALSTGHGRTDLRSSERGVRREAQGSRYRFEPRSNSRFWPAGRPRGRARVNKCVLRSI